ncbi:Imidazolonepropionase [Geodermatophilus pulveris]|uniref:Imidazolonepropionase n=1 Tax=Geodermatophilus pulveris TaxID=1564159 RepID=A0A239IDB2_9ACTN|nr:amidohydrolase family protein [Geodermatophilus pulveris]SNS91228.1 Imidazolonepropionase [Geodermatophilus pulveris]
MVRDAFVVTGAAVFDGTRFRPPASVLVVADRIAAVEDRLTPPTGATVVEAAGATLLPGLVDAHTHVSAGALEAALRCGVTTEVDMFADPALIRSLRARAAADPAALADVRSAGTGATAPGGHPTVLVDLGRLAPFPTIARPDQAAAFVAARIAEGSDHLKVVLEDGTTTGRAVPRLPDDVLRALVTAAHAEGLVVVAHALTQADALAAVRAGVDGLAHLFLDEPPSEEFVAAAAGSGVFVVPTLTSLAARSGSRRGPALAADPHLGPLLDPAQRSLLLAGFPAGPGARADLRHALDAVPRLRDAGVRLLAGTDAASPGTAHGASLHDELDLLVQAGLAPGEALTAATAAPAAAFPALADRGRLAPGLAADLVLVDGGPRADVTVTRRIRAVWRRGRRVPLPGRTG